MAKNKRSFLLYTDVHHTVKKLSDEQAGKLFKHILAYVNDENPITNDFIIEIAFEPIKQSLKRDLERYEAIIERNKINGSKGGRPKTKPLKPKKPTGLSRNPKNPDEPKKADSDNDSDNGIKKREEMFSLAVFEFSNQYPKSMLSSFINYWAEKNTAKKKMKFELQDTFEISKRLVTWSNRDKIFNKSSFEPEEIILRQTTLKEGQQ